VTAERAARAAAVLFVVAAALFAVGTSTEPDGHDEASEGTSAEAHVETDEGEGGEEAHDEGSDGGEGQEETAEGEAGESGADEDDGEKLLVLDVESPAAVALAVVASLLVAAALWIRPIRPVAIGAVALGAVFAVFDIAEAAHQLDESRTSYAVLAMVIAAAHSLAALASGRVAWNPT